MRVRRKMRISRNAPSGSVDGSRGGMVGDGPSSGGSLSFASCATYSIRRFGIADAFSTQSIIPESIALRGIEMCSASSGSWAMVRPPRSLIRLMPNTPSLSAPERITAVA